MPAVTAASKQQQQRTPANQLAQRSLPPGLPGFILKLWNLVNDPATDDVIRWDGSGDTLEIRDGNTLAANVLPMYFKHNNLSSFTRQLNMYGFHKLASADSSGLVQFQHPGFRRGCPDLLPGVARQPGLAGPRLSLAVMRSGAADCSTSADVAANAAAHTGCGIGRDGIQAALTDMHSRQTATDEQLRRLCDENHKLWLELNNLRVQHQQQQVAVTWLLDFISAAMSGGGGRKRPHGRMAIEMAPPPGLELQGRVGKRMRALTRLSPPDVCAPPSPQQQAPPAPATPRSPFCAESFTADLNSRQANLDSIVDALENDDSVDFDVEQLLSELGDSQMPHSMPPSSIASTDPVAPPAAQDPDELGDLLDGAVGDLDEPPVLTGAAGVGGACSRLLP